MSKRELMTLAAEERGDLLSLLRRLAPAQWEARSLCTEWSVKDVATHVVSYDELSKPALLGTFVRGGGSLKKVNAVALRRYEGIDSDGVLDLLGRNLRPSGVTAGLGGGIALTDATIHHQDIRRALGLSRNVPQNRLLPVLDFALGAPVLPARRNAKGLRLSATDVQWTHGVGEEVSGPGEALLMAVAGRPHSLDELSGPGLVTLRQRVRHLGAA